MRAIFNRTNCVGAVLLVTAILFTGSAFAQSFATFNVTKEFSDDNGSATATIGVTCDYGSASPQGDGTLGNDEEQTWNINWDEPGDINNTCRAQESPIPAGYTGSNDGGPEGSCDSPSLDWDDGDGSCTITNTLNTDTIRVYKQFTDGATYSVDVTMNCTSGNVDNTGNTYNTKSVAGGNYVSFNVTGFNQTTDESGESTTCTITESNLPDEYFQVSATGCSQTMYHQDNSGDCTLTNGPDRATFIVEKIWDQRGPTDALEVNAHLSCTGATSTEQDVVFTATTNAVMFVYNIHDIPEGQQVDCTITEDVPEGYRARYDCNDEGCGDSSNNVQACFYSDVAFYGVYTCTITNRPRPAIVTVTKTWIIEGASQGFDGGFWLGANCDSPIDGPQDREGCYGSPFDCWAEIREDDATLGSTDYEFTIIKPNYPFTRCAFWENPDDNVVEVENGCGRLKLGPAGEAECEFVNTVFFEGIPTLNEYGMAILALLMLGMGFVSFRRFA